jgi:hypothetical protein
MPRASHRTWRKRASFLRSVPDAGARCFVPPLHMGQLSTLLAYRLVALLGDYRPVCLPKIAVATSSLVAFGNPLPQPTTSSLAPVADGGISEHLTAVARQGDPYPAFVGFLADEKDHSSSSSSTSPSEGGAGGKVRAKEGKLAAFFEPARDGVARDPEGASETPKTGAFLVGAKDLLAPFGRVGVGAGVLAALPTAIMAEVLLFAVGGLAVLDDVFTVAVVADDDLSNHSWILSFGLDPLPHFTIYSPLLAR